jgi:Spy/CpxP family protein refolding chaperone
MTRRPLVAALAATVLLALAPAAHAQLEKLRGTTPAFRAGLQTDMMKSRLELTPKQVEQVQKINLDTAEKMQPIIDGNQGPLREMGQAREIETKKTEALGKVLTPAQMEKYQAQKEEMRKKLMQRIVDSGD